MPHRQKIAVKAKALVRCREALKLVGDGLRLTDVAARMGCSTDSVQRYVRRALETESMFPSSLTPEAVSEMRVLEAEKLATSTQRVVTAQTNALRRLGDSSPRVQADAELSILRCHEALVRSSERLARLFGLDQPTRIVEESMRIQLTKVDGEIRVKCDGSGLRPRWTPLGEVDCKGERYDQVVLPPEPRQPALEDQE